MKKVEMTFPDGATPLDPSESEGLIPNYVSTLGELNILEQANITDAYLWAQRANLDDLLTATFILNLHKKMFDRVWKWAGKQRGSNKNIGVSKERIMQELGVLLKDAEFWISNSTYSPDEIGTRFHHRLVQIHVFSNGNGRHARFATNLLLKRLGVPVFTWGAASDPTPLDAEGKTRQIYISALRKADNGDYQPLLAFVRT